MGVFCAFSLGGEFKTIKLQKSFFLPSSDKSAIENNPRTQLRLFSHKAVYTQPSFTCSKSTIETLEQIVKYVQS